MSVRVMTAVWALALPDSEKIVLLALADCANDEGFCWPSMATLAAKCSKSDRTVQAAVKELVGKGHLTRKEIPGKGCSYIVHPRSDVAPEEASPPKGREPTPEAASDKPSRTIIPKKDKPSLGARPTRLPANFIPLMTGKTKATVDGWPPGRLEDELEHFCDHHTAKGTTSHCWQASWRTWVKNSKRWEPRNGNRQSLVGQGDNLRGSRPSPALDMLRAARAEEGSERDQGFGGGAWPSLPPLGAG